MRAYENCVARIRKFCATLSHRKVWLLLKHRRTPSRRIVSRLRCISSEPLRWQRASVACVFVQKMRTNAGLRVLPTRQLRNLPRKHSGDKTGHSELHNLFPHPRLHLSHGNIRQNKLSVLITMTAIHRARRSVSISATAHFIPFQRHSATLAILIRLIHNFEYLSNHFVCFLSSFAAREADEPRIISRL